MCVWFGFNFVISRRCLAVTLLCFSAMIVSIKLPVKARHHHDMTKLNPKHTHTYAAVNMFQTHYPEFWSERGQSCQVYSHIIPSSGLSVASPCQVQSHYPQFWSERGQSCQVQSHYPQFWSERGQSMSSTLSPVLV